MGIEPVTCGMNLILYHWTMHPPRCTKSDYILTSDEDITGINLCKTLPSFNMQLIQVILTLLTKEIIMQVVGTLFKSNYNHVKIARGHAPHTTKNSAASH